jgi:hypothetical protein
MPWSSINIGLLTEAVEEIFTVNGAVRPRIGSLETTPRSSAPRTGWPAGGVATARSGRRSRCF